MFAIVEMATQYPFKCALSGTELGPFVDTGIDYETRTGAFANARIYIATSVLPEILQVAGLLGDPHATAMHEAAIYNRGKLDAVKEGLGNDVRRVADSLGALAAELVSSVLAVGTQEDHGTVGPDDDPFG
jgi:hypothetical protein